MPVIPRSWQLQTNQFWGYLITVLDEDNEKAELLFRVKLKC
jgi:hypothetical protein